MPFGNPGIGARRRRGIGGGGIPSGAPSVPVQVVVTPASATPNANQTQLYTAVTKDALGGVVGGRTYTWDTSDHSKATIVNNNNGTATVTALAACNSAVTVTATDVAASLNGTATVGPIAVASVAVSPASANIAMAGTQVYTATPKDANGVALTGRTVTIDDSNHAIASIVDNGNATATTTGVAGGTVTVTATCETIQGTATCSVVADLFRYVVGGSTGVFTLTRATAATYRDVNGVLQTAATGVIRDAHYIGATRTMLLEKLGTNRYLRSEAFDNASWTKTRTTATADQIAGPDGNVTAELIKEDSTASSTHVVTQAPSTQPGTVNAVMSVFAKAKERTWVALTTTARDGTTTATTYFDLTNGVIGTVGSGHTATMIAYASGWYRCAVGQAMGASGTGATGSIGLATGDTVNSYSGDGASGLYLWGGDWENLTNDTSGLRPTSYIATTSAAVNRNADQLNFTPPAVQALTVYVDFIDNWDACKSALNQRFWALGRGEVTADCLYCRDNGSGQGTHYNGAAASSGAVSFTTLGVVLGDEVEIRGLLTSVGACQFGFARNGGAETLSTASGSNANGASWANNEGELNGSANTNFGMMGIKSFKIQSGNRTLAEMRAL